MPTAVRHILRPASLALAALAGLLLAPVGASASCEAMKSAGSCSPSQADCCCKTPASATSEVIQAASLSQEVCPAAGSCSCSDRPQAPAEPAPKSTRLLDEGRFDRGDTLAVELPDLRPSTFPIAPRPASTGSPPHVPLFLRHSRFLI